MSSATSLDRALHAIADPTRRRILLVLKEGRESKTPIPKHLHASCLCGGDIEERIQGILQDRLQIQPPGSDDDLFDAGFLDSLSFVDLLVALEDEFSVRIALDQIDLNDFRSISKIGGYIAAQNEKVRAFPA